MAKVKISELPSLSPATLDTTFVVGISDSTTYKILQEVIPVELKAYYSPVTAFEVEEARNTSKKEILVLDSQYEGRINDALFKALR